MLTFEREPQKQIYIFRSYTSYKDQGSRCTCKCSCSTTNCWAHMTPLAHAFPNRFPYHIIFLCLLRVALWCFLLQCLRLCNSRPLIGEIGVIKVQLGGWWAADTPKGTETTGHLNKWSACYFIHVLHQLLRLTITINDLKSYGMFTNLAMLMLKPFVNVFLLFAEKWKPNNKLK